MQRQIEVQPLGRDAVPTKAAREERLRLHGRRDAPREVWPLLAQLLGVCVRDRAVEVDVAPGVGVPAGEAPDEPRREDTIVGAKHVPGVIDEPLLRLGCRGA